jgi:nucleotide-binding universal stress UspA family protein
MAAVAKKIMVGYDGSDAARRALDRAAELAGYGSVVTVVTVVGVGGVGRGRALLAEARDRLLSRHVRALYVEPAGDPAESLIDRARELQADLLVVGRSGANASPSVEGVPDAPCDVLVVR